MSGISGIKFVGGKWVFSDGIDKDKSPQKDQLFFVYKWWGGYTYFNFNGKWGYTENLLFEVQEINEKSCILKVKASI